MKATSLTHHRRILLAILSAAALVGFACPAYAQQSAATSVEGALQAHFSADSKAADAAVLRDAGYAYERMLIAEMLPSEATLFAEVELAQGDVRLRYPLKLARKLDGDMIVWQVSWAPVEAYARGLVQVAGEGGLASVGETGTSWADVERLPAFPVIVGDTAFVTPYGRVAAPETVGKAATADEAKSQLPMPKELSEHAQRWVGLTLEDEPGTANVDLLLSRGVAWTRVTQALMAPASLGLFRTYLIGRAGGQVVAHATAAPVVRQTPSGAEPMVVGMYRRSDKHAFRMRIGDDLIEGDDVCAERMTFCTGAGDSASLDIFKQQVLDLVSAAIKEDKNQIAYVMFAATGEFGAGEVVRHLKALGTALGVPTSKLFIGYIGAE
jgi:hypothetical protein